MKKLDIKTIDQIISKLTDYQIETYEFIDKGYSDDKKYLLISADDHLLLKISPLDRYERKLEEFELMKSHYKNGVKCPQPLGVYKFDDLNVCALLLTYLEGQSSECLLSDMSIYDQYRLGKEAAKELKKMHELKPDHDVNWYENRWQKYLSKKRVLEEMNFKFDHQTHIEAYIEANFHILKESPVRFQHDDFYPMNIIVKNDQVHGVIDFEKFSWGNPIEDFFKLPKYTNDISEYFATGQVDGYFDGQVPGWFWRRYNLFIALNYHASYIGAFSYDNLETVKIRQDKIFQEHDFINHQAPAWYKKCSIELQED